MSDKPTRWDFSEVPDEWFRAVVEALIEGLS